MIPISYTDFFVFLITALMVYAGWLWHRSLSRQKHNAWQISHNRLFHCNNCHHSFVPHAPVSLCRCPKCNTVCIRQRSDLLLDSPRHGDKQ